jgi:thiaminase
MKCQTQIFHSNKFQANFDVPKITEGIKKMEELHQTQAASKEKALRSQVMYTAYMMYHGASGNFIDCQAAVFPQLFDDSKLTKIWDIRCNELIGFKYF